MRTLLILVALVALGLGLWVHPAEQQRRAIQTLRRAGAAIHYRPKDPADFKDLRSCAVKARVAGAEYLANLETNRRRPGSVPQALIDRPEAEWRQAEEAIAKENRPSWLPGWLLPDDWFQHVRSVDLIGCQLKDEVAALTNLPGLEYLNLNRSSVTDANVPELSLLKSLRSLRLLETEVSDEGERELQKALPHCTIWR